MNKLLAPHIRTEDRSRSMLNDVLLAAIALCVFSVVNYGLRPAILMTVSMLSAIFTEWICLLFQRKSGKAALDGSAAVTGAIVALVMPPMVSYWVPMLGSCFAILVAKVPFGGYGRNVFNPAAAGIAVLSYCFPRRVFSYSALSAADKLPLSWEIASAKVVTETSLAAQLRSGATPTVTRMQLLLGDFAGPIGATATLILIACAAYLLCRRSASPYLMIPYLITCCLLAWMIPYTGTGRVYGAMAQMCSGYVLFTGVFLLNDPVTTPRFRLGRIFYGVFTGVLVMLLQHIGRVEAGSCFAILIMNVLAPIIDRWSWHIWRYITQLLRIRQEVNAHE